MNNFESFERNNLPTNRAKGNQFGPLMRPARFFGRFFSSKQAIDNTQGNYGDFGQPYLSHDLRDPLYDLLFEDESLSRERSFDELTSLIDVLFGAKSVLKENVTNSKYTIFPTPESRRNVKVAAASLTEYLKGNKINNLVLIDRAARPAALAVRAYWNVTYPGEKLPFSIYYVNPRGFIDNLLQEAGSYGEPPALIVELYKGIMSDDSISIPSGQRSKKDILREFGEKYKQLMQSKNEPVMLYDNCIHTGRSIRPVLTAFREMGFSKVLVGSAGNDMNISGIKSDFIAMPDYYGSVCSIFGTSRIVEKTFDAVHSSPSKLPSKFKGESDLRREIKAIMEDPSVSSEEYSLSEPENLGYLRELIKEMTSLTGTRNSDRDVRISYESTNTYRSTGFSNRLDMTLKDLETSVSKYGDKYKGVSETYQDLMNLGYKNADEAVAAINLGYIPKEVLEKIVANSRGGVAIAPYIAEAASAALRFIDRSI